MTVRKEVEKAFYQYTFLGSIKAVGYIVMFWSKIALLLSLWIFDLFTGWMKKEDKKYQREMKKYK
jgi:hypothetical protein